MLQHHFYSQGINIIELFNNFSNFDQRKTGKVMKDQFLQIFILLKLDSVFSLSEIEELA